MGKWSDQVKPLIWGSKELKSNLIAKRKSLEVCVSELLIPRVLKIVTVAMERRRRSR